MINHTEAALPVLANRWVCGWYITQAGGPIIVANPDYNGPLVTLEDRLTEVKKSIQSWCNVMV